MKKTLFTLIFIAFSLICFAQINAIDYESLNKTALNHLVSLINIDTAQPNPNEILAQRYIYKNLIDKKIDWRIFRMEKHSVSSIWLPESRWSHSHTGS